MWCSFVRARMVVQTRILRLFLRIFFKARRHFIRSCVFLARLLSVNELLISQDFLISLKKARRKTSNVMACMSDFVEENGSKLQLFAFAVYVRDSWHDSCIAVESEAADEFCILHHHSPACVCFITGRRTDSGWYECETTILPYF